MLLVSFVHVADLLDGGVIDLGVKFVACVISNTFLEYTDENDDAEDDGHDERRINSDLWERVQNHHTQPSNVRDFGELDDD